LKLNPGEHQTQLEAGRETANALGSYAERLDIPQPFQQKGSKSEAGSGKVRVCRNSPAE
jgi:hypothetical protein